MTDSLELKLLILVRYPALALGTKFWSSEEITKSQLVIHLSSLVMKHFKEGIYKRRTN